MSADKLNDAKVKAANAREKDYKLGDGKGMYLLVTAAGAKYWRLKYRYGGKEKTLALGVYPEVSLREARDRRDDARKVLRDGKDPVLVKKEVERQARLGAANSFRVVAEEWHEKQSGRWSADHAQRVLDSLEKDVFPSIGSWPITEIKPPIVLDAIRKVEKRGALDVASRVLQRVNAVFRYAVQTGRTDMNPAADLVGTIQTRKITHRPALKETELPEFIEKLESYDGHVITKLALRLIVLTFVRSRELRGAMWDEFDLDKAEWRIPAERMKMKDEHIVPLSTQSVEVLRQLHILTGKRDLVFPGQNSPRKIMSENTLLYAMYRMGYHSRATVHGFRATASTVLNENGFHKDAIERQLAHAERNKVRAAYHRSEYLDERRRMMQWWADYLDGVVKESQNVVSFKRHA